MGDQSCSVGGDGGHQGQGTERMDPALEQGTKKERNLHWNGWGFKDSYFYLDDNMDFYFAGKQDDGRYHISGHTLGRLNAKRPLLGVEADLKTPSQDFQTVVDSVADPILNETFIHHLTNHSISYSMDKKLRLNRGHGHTVNELYALRHGKLARVPDVVVWPRNHDDVVSIVAAADANNVVIIPHGGGTNVTLAIQCPENEKRMIISLDMALMNRLLWINRENLTACGEAGCVGSELEEELNKMGYTTGHEPDSVELSTLGGWIATRASGMKRMKYGNIEDILVGVTVVTPRGVLDRSSEAPRSSSGPDVVQIILGSEGTLGVVTRAIFRIKKKPECKRYNSFLLPNFEAGVKCMREMTLLECMPASMRLVDNVQFGMGRAFKTGPLTVWGRLKDQIQDLYITSWKGFDLDEVCAMTVVFEGGHEEVKYQEMKMNQCATKHRGFSGGQENGRLGYILTLAIAYLRDIGMEHCVLGDSMETSISWDKVLELCNRVKAVIEEECAKVNVHNCCSFRVTQAYGTGACIYIYFSMNYRNVDDPMETYEIIESKARDVISACGGTISHHHGVGKLKMKWYPAAIGDVGVTVVRAVKQALDPNNIFACGNQIDYSKAQL